MNAMERGDNLYRVTEVAYVLQRGTLNTAVARQ